MIRYKALLNNESCVIDFGKTYIFDSMGNCKKEDAGLTPQLTTGMQELPIISVLSAGERGSCEVLGFQNDSSIKRYTAREDSIYCVTKITGQGGSIRSLRRSGVSDGIKFNQIIFVYPVGVDISSILSKLNLDEGVGL